MRGRGPRPTGTATRCKAKSGMALLLVLGAVALLSVLVVGMMLSARTEVASAKAYAAGSDVRLLADTAVNLVIGQLQSATQNPDEAWISQPGMVRTFTPQGQKEAFKLYSSYRMVESGNYNPSSPGAIAQEVPANWFDQPDEFVDLNKPVHDASGNPVYPIADPRAEGEVEGFRVNDAQTPRPANSHASYNELPMPVRWIYLDADGNLMPWGDPDIGKAVARIAFWADDETSKVNINTACGGVFFDAPVANTKEDHMLGRTQPIAQEYQRWPGHPATTSLAAVFKELRNETDPVARARKAAEISPRIAWGGSEGGTKYAWWTRSLGQTDIDRLYATVDELIYKPELTNQNGEKSRIFQPTVATTSAQQSFNHLNFFLTAQSRAPDLNLFHRPRVTLWPFNRETLSDSPTNPRLTPEDRIIREASELGDKKFYVQRERAWEPRHDFENIPENQALFRYLQAMTERPLPSANPTRSGSGQTLEGKVGENNRNQTIVLMMDYLRSYVNTTNQAYKPVGGVTYSFPQSYDTTVAGYDDIAPLLVEADGEIYKGTGTIPVINEIIFQFYAREEKFATINPSLPYNEDTNPYVDLVDNDTGAPGADNFPDYVVRAVQMVVLFDLRPPYNLLNSGQGQFQIEMTASSPFVMSVANVQPDGALNKDPVEVRVAGSPGGWAVNNQASLGFPGGLNYTLVLNQGFENFGDQYRLGAAMKYTDNMRSNATSSLQYKAKIFSRAAGPDAYQRYPFVGDMLEFRIPAKKQNTPAVKFEPRAILQPPNDLVLSVYPGLRHGATTFNDVQERSDENLLQRMPLSLLTSAVIPLPRLGLIDEPITNFGGASSTYGTMADYAKRFFFGTTAPDDYLMLVPRVLNNRSYPFPLDTFLSCAISGASPLNGDLRLVALRRQTPVEWLQLHPLWGATALHGVNAPKRIHHATFFMPNSVIAPNIDTTPETGFDYSFVVRPDLIRTAPANNNDVRILNGKTGSLLPLSMFTTNPPYASAGRERTIAPSANGAIRRDGSLGDYSDGYGVRGGGALIVGTDCGAIVRGITDASVSNITSPYFATGISRSTADDLGEGSDKNAHFINFTGLLYSPLKAMPSPVLFGTLPARVWDSTAAPWETLLFCPNPAGGQASHRGWDGPRDHYWLDLFTMPVVEPYAMTEGFATAGKINLNYTMAPFGYVERKTGLYALMRDLQIVAAPPSVSNKYKPNPNAISYQGADSNLSVRHPVDVAQTLTAFDTRLITQNDPFVSSSEICEMFMVPEGQTPGSMTTFWNTNKMTGDDKREMPYNHLYPRVTTQSNTFKVHFWVQTLMPNAKSPTPIVTGQFRGSTMVERFLDPNLETYGDPVPGGSGSINVDAVYPPLNDKYRYRKVEARQFAL